MMQVQLIETEDVDATGIYPDGGCKWKMGLMNKNLAKEKVAKMSGKEIRKRKKKQTIGKLDKKLLQDG